MMTRTLLLALAVAGPLAAQDAPKAPAFADTVAPFIDEHTLVVARVDASRIRPESLPGLMTILGATDEEAAVALTEVKAWLAEFTKKGGRDVFVTYGAADFPNLPVLLIPIGESPEERKDLGELVKLPFGDDPDVAVEKIHGCMAVGKKGALAALKTRKAVKRFDLLEALETGKEDVVQIVLAMPEDAKKIYEQIAPLLPDELGGGSIIKFTRGVKWMALTVGPAPGLTARWTVATATPDAFKDVGALQATLRKMGGKMLADSLPPAADALRPKLEKAFAAVTAKDDGMNKILEWELGPALKEFKKDLPAAAPEAADRLRSMNNLKQLVLALHGYHDVYGHFPADIRDKDGKPLLSWRVQILPFIEQDALFKKFKLDEAWDGPNNKQLAKMTIKVFMSPRQKTAEKHLTTYLAPLGKGFAWDDPKGVKITDIADGTSNTILLLEADDEAAVPWAKPGDLTIEPERPLKNLLGHYAGSFNAAFADGSVRFFKKTLPAETLKAYLTRNGGEVIQEENDKLPRPKTPPPK